MKYLRKFNEDEQYLGPKVLKNQLPISIDIIKHDINDICLELEDIGFIITTDFVSNLKSIIIKKNNEATIKFKYSAISEVVNRLIDYLGDRISYINIAESIYLGPNTILEPFEDIDNYDIVSYVKLFFNPRKIW